MALYIYIYICLPVSFKNRNQRENQYGMRLGIQLAHLLHRKLTKAACFWALRIRKRLVLFKPPRKNK